MTIIIDISWEEALALLVEMGRERDTDMKHYAPERAKFRAALHKKIEAYPGDVVRGELEYASWFK